MGFITCSDWIHVGDWTASDASDWPSRDSLYSATWSHSLYFKLKLRHPLKFEFDLRIGNKTPTERMSWIEDRRRRRLQELINILRIWAFQVCSCPYSFKYCHSILHCHHPHQVNKLLLNYEPPPSYHSTPSTTHHPAIKSPGTLSRLNHLDSIWVESSVDKR